MLIKSITIKNFRGYYGETKIDFEDLTTFVGKNDVGKSTILEALDIFFNDKPASPMDKSDLNKQALANGNTDIVIGVEFKNPPTNVVVDTTNSTTLQDEHLLNENDCLEIIKHYSNGSSSAKIYVKALHPTYEECSDLLSRKLNDLKKVVEEKKLECADKTKKAELRKAIWQHYQDELALSLHEVDMSKEDAKGIIDNLKAIMPAYSLFQSDRSNNDTDKEVQDPLKAAVKAIMQDPEIVTWCTQIAGKVTTQLQTVANSTLQKLQAMNNGVAATLNPKIPGVAELKWQDVFKSVSITGDNDIAINKRGSGVRRLVLLNFFRAQAEANIGNHSGIIYAIEEPETSQHIEHQKLLINALKSMADQNNIQVILTTHSSQIVKMLDYSNLRLVKDNAGVKTVERVATSILPYTSLNDVNYVAFGDASIEYFNELYGYLEETHQLQNFFNGKPQIPYVRQLKDGTTITERLTKEAIIRNIIHHPENRNNTYNEQELQQAIVGMRAYISALSRQVGRNNATGPDGGQ